MNLHIYIFTCQNALSDHITQTTYTSLWLVYMPCSRHSTAIHFAGSFPCDQMKHISCNFDDLVVLLCESQLKWIIIFILSEAWYLN